MLEESSLSSFFVGACDCFLSLLKILVAKYVFESLTIIYIKKIVLNPKED